MGCDLFVVWAGREATYVGKLGIPALRFTEIHEKTARPPSVSFGLSLTKKDMPTVTNGLGRIPRESAVMAKWMRLLVFVAMGFVIVVCPHRVVRFEC